jgi:hypothetical protein
MTPRTLFTIIIKVIGIYLLFSIIESLPQLLETIFFYPNYDHDLKNYMLEDGGIILAVAAMTFLTWLCFYRTDYIIDKLSLDRHFPEEKIEINIHRSTVLTLAIIIAGCLIFINAIPPFLEEVFEYFHEKSVIFSENPTSKRMIFFGAKLFIGLLMLANCRLIVNQIERKRRSTDIETGDEYEEGEENERNE